MANKSVNDPGSLGWTDDGNGFWSWSGDGDGSDCAGMVVSATEPTDPIEGMQWLNSDTAEVFIFDGAVWLEFPAGSGGSGGGLWEANGDDIFYDKGNVSVSGSVDAVEINRNGYSGIHFTTNYLLPMDSTGAFSTGEVDLGHTSYKFKAGYFSGTVNATTFFRPTKAGITFVENTLVPVDKDFSSANENVDLGRAANKFKDGHFSGIVNAGEGQWNGQKIWRNVSGAGGLNFTNTNEVRPTNEYGVNVDGALSLGNGSYRFKDAHFSGNVTSGQVTLITQGIYRSGKSGLWFSPDAFTPMNGNGGATTGITDLGGTANTFKNAYFSGTVTAGTAYIKTGSTGPRSGSQFGSNGGALQLNNTFSNFEPTVDAACDLGSTEFNFKSAFFSGRVTANTFDGSVVRSSHVIQDGAPVIDAKGLISTLSTLRKATMDETQDIRESLRSAIDELVEGFEQEIATMPAGDSE